MNEETDEKEKKAGHLPATKVGGMRVVQHKDHHEFATEPAKGEHDKAQKPKDEEGSGDDKIMGIGGLHQHHAVALGVHDALPKGQTPKDHKEGMAHYQDKFHTEPTADINQHTSHGNPGMQRNAHSKGARGI